MARDDNPRDDLLRRFEAVISGAELDDLRQLVGDLSLLGGLASQEAFQPPSAELRRPPLPDLRIFRVRVDLKRSRPAIWRRLEVRSDLTLDVVHRVLQVAFGWSDTHLWRFSLGGEPFGRAGQAFLCPWDVEEGDVEDDGAVAASEVRLDETMQDVGDVLHYVYDYGDNWELALRLEDVASAPADCPSAVVVAGRRAAPPEDCGGITDGAELAELLEDPESVDIEALNTSLRMPYVALTEHNVDRRLIDLIDRLAYSPLGEDLQTRAVALMSDPEPPDREELDQSLRAFTWFLDQAADGGIPLTAAGYLRPADVAAVARVLPTMGGWIGKANRESETTPVLHFRKTLQSPLGLLRKHKGVLRLTRTGASAQQAPEELWNHLADRLVPAVGGFDTDAALLLLAFAATSAESEIPLGDVATALTTVGWRAESRPIERWDLYGIPALEVLCNVTTEPTTRAARWRISPAAAKLARAALQKR